VPPWHTCNLATRVELSGQNGSPRARWEPGSQRRYARFRPIENRSPRILKVGPPELPLLTGASI
jgi:hypothetical protein